MGGGAKTIRELHSINPEIIGVVASGYVDDIVMANYKAYGLTAAIAKPFTMTTIKQVLSDIEINLPTTGTR